MSLRRLTPAVAASVAVLVAAITALAQDPSASPASANDPSGTDPAAPDITVGGVEYAFTGLPTSVPAGTTFGFDNQGAELHQLLVVRKNEGVTETWDELLAMPDAESNSKVTLAGHLIVGPGKASPDTFAVEEEGDYFAVCLIPQGTTHDPTVTFDPMATADPAAAQASGEPVGGVPHAFLGMQQEFTVTAAGSSLGPISESPGPAAGEPSGSPAA